MAKQYLMLRISSFRAQELSQDMGVPEALFRVPPQRRARFFDHLCDAEAGHTHLTAYPPVREGTTGMRDSPAPARGECEASRGQPVLRRSADSV